MKYTALAAALVASPAMVRAHYFFDRLVINGVSSSMYEFVRENGRDLKYMPTKFINSDGITPLDDDFRCNQGSFAYAAQTGTANVSAGDSLAMQIAVGARMQHPGPGQVYMSRADDDTPISEYDGSGDWFKIAQVTVCGSADDGLQDTDWCTWDQDRINFTIPADTPPGEYLIRAEHIALHGGVAGEAEFYYSCAQVRVSGSGTGVPYPTTKIPGIYSNDDPGIRFSIYNGDKYTYHLGPAIWTGGSNTSASSSSSSVANSTTTSSIATSSTAPTSNFASFSNITSSGTATPSSSSTATPSSTITTTSGFSAAATSSSAGPLVTSSASAAVDATSSSAPSANMLVALSSTKATTSSSAPSTSTLVALSSTGDTTCAAPVTVTVTVRRTARPTVTTHTTTIAKKPTTCKSPVTVTVTPTVTVTVAPTVTATITSFVSGRTGGRNGRGRV